MTTNPVLASAEPAAAASPADSAPALRVEVSATVSVEETVDLLALFTSMNEREQEQERYFALDAREYAMAAEWERPLAYLWPNDDDLIPLAMVRNSRTHPRGMLNDSDVRVITRNGARTTGRDGRWTEDDFTTLARQVEWLAAAAGGPHVPAADHEASPLTVEVTATFDAEETVDLVAVFNAMDARERQRYLDLDLHEVGMSVEWERPLGYLWPADDDVVPLTMVPGAVSHPRGDIDEAHVRVTHRNGTPFYGRDGEWSEDDYDTLVAHVPWLRSIVRQQEMSDFDRSRLPGPHDVPLFADL